MDRINNPIADLFEHFWALESSPMALATAVAVVHVQSILIGGGGGLGPIKSFILRPALSRPAYASASAIEVNPLRCNRLSATVG